MPFGWQGNAPFSSKKKKVKVMNECGENMKREFKKKHVSAKKTSKKGEHGLSMNSVHANPLLPLQLPMSASRKHDAT